MTGKRLASLQGLFEFGQRESGINGQEGVFGIGSLEGSVLAAALPQPVAENIQQWPRLVAVGDSNDPFRARQRDQLPGLLHIPFQQDQKFRGPACLVLAPLVAFNRYVARQQRQNFLARDLLTDAGHAQKRTQRSRDDYACTRYWRRRRNFRRLRAGGGVRS